MKKLGLLMGFVILLASPWGCGGVEKPTQVPEDRSTPLSPTGTEISTPLDTITPKLTETKPPTATPTTGPVRITVTFEGDQCLRDGPRRLPPGEIQFVLDVENQIVFRRSYGYVVYKVDEGRILKDLMAVPFIPKEPFWAHPQVSFEGIESGSANKKSVVILDGPIFLVCAVQDGEMTRKTNVIGPIAVDL